ncbi:MAG: mechanosensitive ion channel family protein [Candidatus Pacebacteria bacterium]|nr:mechanosensitive ion channel family protein [Candidatus Paceibacterota bacterium]MDD4073993.1 mechanosensitive ion channel family protein [Candidatus Paceibacterota bacterium]
MIELNYILLGNDLFSYIKFLLSFLVLFFILKIIRNVLLKRFLSASEYISEIIKLINSYFCFFISFYISIRFLNINDFIQRALDIILIIWLVLEIMKIANIIINYLVKRSVDGNYSNSYAINLLATTSKVILWLIAILFTLSNLGINITSFVAGLGIGGIAIAFAVQNILSDLFSSFAIHLDKPFVVGDFINFGSQKGTVKKIGIKTTRLKSLSGEEIVVSNKELTSSIIQNFKKMKKRRIVFSFGIVYGTPTKKIKKVPEIIKRIISNFDLAEVERVHFKNFGSSSLDFEVVFNLDTPDYNNYMDIQEGINIKIMEAFEKEKIEFAYPTQTIYTKKN